MISIGTIKQISSHIMLAWPYDKDNEWKRLNTFATIRNRSDWSDESFGHAATDKYSYCFANRTGDNKRKSGYLTLENRDVVLKNHDSATVCTDLWFTVAYAKTCTDHCKPKDKLSEHALYLEAVNTLRKFIKELCRWQKYEVVLPDNKIDHLWMTPEVKQKKLESGQIKECKKDCGTIKGYVHSGQNKELQIYESDLGTHGLVGASIKLRICSCEPVEELELNCNYESCDNGGAIACPCE